MRRSTLGGCAIFFLLGMLPFGNLFAQGVCDSGNGPLDPAVPSGIAPSGIIQEFTAKEAKFKAARERYGYTLNVTVQTLDDNGRADGEYKQITEIVLNDDGKRTEKAVFAPMSTLRKLSLSEDDMDDIRERLPFSLTTDELPHFSVTYVGRQRVDQLKTYVFEVSPINPKKDKKLFKGRIWVDDLDLMIVKTCGKPRADEIIDAKKKSAIANLTPVFVTYREQVDGQYWFTTYSRADELLRFPNGFVHLREVIKYSDYKPLARK